MATYEIKLDGHADDIYPELADKVQAWTLLNAGDVTVHRIEEGCIRVLMSSSLEIFYRISQVLSSPRRTAFNASALPALFAR